MDRRSFTCFGVALLYPVASSPGWAHGHAGTAQQQRLQGAQHRFDALAAEAAQQPLGVRAEFVNSAVNRLIDYSSDEQTSQQHDRWNTPLETLALGAGDCEDYAITKFFLLLASGAPPRGLRLLYAQRCAPDTPHVCSSHMVALAGWPFDDPWVLDWINPQAVPLSLREDLLPVFSFDRGTVWDQVEREAHAPPRHAPPRQWAEVMQRMQAQSH